jgi:hypothetical protein
MSTSKVVTTKDMIDFESLENALESVYDDCHDFGGEQEEYLKDILPEASEILNRWEITIDGENTFLDKFISPQERDHDKVSHRNELWRRSITSGSKLKGKNEVVHRVNLGQLAWFRFIKSGCIYKKMLLMVYNQRCLSKISF